MCSNSLLDTLKRTMSSYVEIKDIPSFPLMPPSQIVLLSKKDLEICKMELMDILSEPDEEEDALLEYAKSQLLKVLDEIQKRNAQVNASYIKLDVPLSNQEAVGNRNDRTGNRETELPRLDTERREEGDELLKSREICSDVSRVEQSKKPSCKKEDIVRVPKMGLPNSDCVKEKEYAKIRRNTTNNVKRDNDRGKETRPAVMYQQDWASGYVVASSVKKRRRKVKKKKVLTPAEEALVMEKERKIRRQAAQERLLARRKAFEEKRIKERARKKEMDAKKKAAMVKENEVVKNSSDLSDSERTESNSDISSSENDTDNNVTDPVVNIPPANAILVDDAQPMGNETPMEGATRCDIHVEPSEEVESETSDSKGKKIPTDVETIEFSVPIEQAAKDSPTSKLLETVDTAAQVLKPTSDEATDMEVDHDSASCSSIDNASEKDFIVDKDENNLSMKPIEQYPETQETNEIVDQNSPESVQQIDQSPAWLQFLDAGDRNDEILEKKLKDFQLKDDLEVKLPEVSDNAIPKETLKRRPSRISEIAAKEIAQLQRSKALVDQTILSLKSDYDYSNFNSNLSSQDLPTRQKDKLATKTDNVKAEIEKETKSVRRFTTSAIGAPVNSNVAALKTEKSTDEKSAVSISTPGKALSKKAKHNTKDVKRIAKLAKCLPPLDPNIFDYSTIYTSFSAISSSHYEQYTGDRKKAVVSGDAAFRVQLKLYTIWQSIMSDYMSVFSIDNGNKTTQGSLFNPNATSYQALYRVNSSTRPEVLNIVSDAFKKLPEWDELPTGLGLKQTWNFLWTWSKPRVDRPSLLCWQKVNHFPGARALTRKDLLKRHLHRYKAMGGKMSAFDILPETFILPNEYVQFVDSFSKRNTALGESKNLWIMKPVGLSRGRGISLFNDIGQVCYGESVVVQQYIPNPFLLDGYKFDLRVYVLVTSFSPLEAFIYDEGFVRLCMHKYVSDSSEIQNLNVHLTNSSIQKHNTDSMQKDNPVHTAPEHESGGSKTSFSYLWSRFSELGIDVEKVKNNIGDVVLKALVCADDQIPFQVNSFELFGFDVLIDEDLKPWLIEVNCSPSMARDCSIDKIKDNVILDTIKVIDTQRYDRDALVKIIQRRLAESETDRARPYASQGVSPKDAVEIARRQLNADLAEILHGEVPRRYGEMPKDLGGYKRLCPNTPSYEYLLKLKKAYIRSAPNASALHVAQCFRQT